MFGLGEWVGRMGRLKIVVFGLGEGVWCLGWVKGWGVWVG